jgi:hypothetical protein
MENLSPEVEKRINSLIKGAIDMHCHSGPSVMPRRIDHIQALEEASEAGLRAILFKDHYYSATPITELLKDRYQHLGVKMFSGVPLNDCCGGLNPYAVDHGLKLGARLIWMPTFSAANHIRHNYRGHLLATKFPMMPASMLTVVDEKGKIKDEVNFISPEGDKASPVEEDSEEEEEKPKPIKKVIKEVFSDSESESDSDTLELDDNENILSMLDDAESEELEEKKAPKQTRNKKNFKEVVKKATNK